jgi:ABC-type nitrate/sulfonate/bicarbonate transport system permease component
MPERAPRRLAGRWLGGAVVVALLALIELGVRLGSINASLVPPPTEVAVRIADILWTGAFVGPLASTLYLLFIAYFGASALAVAIGLLMGRFRAIYSLFEPLVELLRPLPKPALLPPLILFLGLGDLMKSVVVGLAVFFPVLINTIQGVQGVDPVLINTARTFGYGRFAVLRKVILPAALPLIFAGLRVSLALGLILVVIAEMLAGTGGLGYLILDMQRTFRVQNMYAWLAILAVLGYALNALFLAVEHRLIHWAAARPD